MKDSVSSSGSFGEPPSSPRRRKLPDTPLEVNLPDDKLQEKKADFPFALAVVWSAVFCLAATYYTNTSFHQLVDRIIADIDRGIEEPSIWHVISFACAWCAVFLAYSLLNIREGPPVNVLWNINLTAFTHSIVAMVLATRVVFFSGPWVFDYIGERNLGCHNGVMLMSLGYFLFDFTYCILSNTEGWDMMIHHATSTAGLIMGLLYGTCGAELVACVASSEMSNPLWKLRYFLQETNQRDTPVGLFNDVFFVATFGICRLGWGTALLIRSISVWKQPIPIFTGALLLYCLSVFWFILMIKMIIKKFR